MRRAVVVIAVVGSVVAAAGAWVLSGGSQRGAVAGGRVGLTPCPPVSWRGATAVPDVVGLGLNRASARLIESRLLFVVPSFPRIRGEMPEQGFGQLANYLVVAESLTPGTTVPSRTVVRLTLDTPVFRGPIGSMGEPTRHPKYKRIPSLVGDDYGQAMAAEKGFMAGMYVTLSRTGPLTAAASACGLNGFVVIHQYPRAGTRVLWGGIAATGVDPRLATVFIRLASRRHSPGVPKTGRVTLKHLVL